MHATTCPASDARLFAPSGPLTGRIAAPGDKSISHRALMLAALAVGRSRITGLLDSEDVRRTAAALRQTGAIIGRDGEAWTVDGVGVGGLLQPAASLDMGNSGTSARLLMGLAASHAINLSLTGDESLSGRPMERVIAPLSKMGAAFHTIRDSRLPLIMRGIDPAAPIAYRLPVASAQVKSAVLLAALNTPGTTTVIEPAPTRDHTERMLAAFGAEIEIGEEDGERAIRVHGRCDLAPCDIRIPGDPSSAAFLAVAALLVPRSELTIEHVGLNPTRAGLFEVLREMGARIERLGGREIGGEQVADLRVRHSVLTGIDVDPAIVPRMIDEFPILFVAAALAEGRTTVSGLAELRFKESDRLATMANALRLAGARVEDTPDGLVIEGTGGEPLPGTPEGAAVVTHLDHRVAMSMAVAGLVSRDGVALDTTAPIGTSFPDFPHLLEETARQ